MQTLVTHISLWSRITAEPARLLCHIIVVIFEWQQGVDMEIWLCFMVTLMSDLYCSALQIVCDQLQGQG